MLLMIFNYLKENLHVVEFVEKNLIQKELFSLFSLYF